MAYKLRRKVDEPVQSDVTILMSVENLINMAMGPPNENLIDFKMVQTILMLLARQLRMLETKVDIKIADLPELKKRKKKPLSSDSQPSSESPKHTKNIKEDKTGRGKKRKGKKGGGQDDDYDDDEEEEKAREKEKLDKMSPGERRKYLDDKKKESEEQDEGESKDSPHKRKGTRGRTEEDLEQTSPAGKGTDKDLLKRKKEREERALANMTPEERKKYLKRKKQEELLLENMSPKEREIYLKALEEEELDLERMSPKDRAAYFKEKEEETLALEKMTPEEREKHLRKMKKRMSRVTGVSKTSTTVTEVERDNEKVLVVQKSAAGRKKSHAGPGSIDVVTVSQFELLEDQVQMLTEIAGPLPMPTMPSDKQLKRDLMKGSASLTDTMQAMQVAARVQAAEAGLARMAGLLTQLAASGALPESFASQLREAQLDMEALATEALGAQKGTHGRKSVGIDLLSTKLDHADGESRTTGTGKTSRPSSAGADKRASAGAMSVGSRYSRASSIGRGIPVTRNEMDDAIQALRDDMMKNMQSMAYRASSSSEAAAGIAKGIAEKMEIAMNLNSRISTLHALTTEYAEQLAGFDAGLTTQMQSFQEQITQMRGDLKDGLVQLETANNNAETAAVQELSERYEGLQHEIEESLVEHQVLNNFQTQLGDELQLLIDAVEMLREQKADRDEVLDGLRDKADQTRLAGLLTEEAFAISRAELDTKLEICYKKFSKQENVWLAAMRDLTEVARDKAEAIQLLSIKDDTQAKLRSLQEHMRLLTILLGEPKAAILTRLLSRDGTCGACKEIALMEAADKRGGAPPVLPALRPPPDGEPCGPELPTTVIEDENIKSHMCNRWAGGSHTLVSRRVPREVAPAQITTGAQPVKKYVGFGDDGKVYNLEEELLPCVECNQLSAPAEPPGEAGAGDTEPKVCDCWPGVEAASKF